MRSTPRSSPKKAPSAWLRWAALLGLRTSKPPPRKRGRACAFQQNPTPPGRREAVDVEALTCGWFDSSHALSRGLDVSEPTDPAPDRA